MTKGPLLHIYNRMFFFLSLCSMNGNMFLYLLPQITNESFFGIHHRQQVIEERGKKSKVFQKGKETSRLYVYIKTT